MSDLPFHRIAFSLATCLLCACQPTPTTPPSPRTIETESLPAKNASESTVGPSAATGLLQSMSGATWDPSAPSPATSTALAASNSPASPVSAPSSVQIIGGDPLSSSDAPEISQDELLEDGLFMELLQDVQEQSGTLQSPMEPQTRHFFPDRTIQNQTMQTTQ